MLIFLSRPEDLHTDWVEVECKHRDIPYLRFHTAYFPMETTMTTSIHQGGQIRGIIQTQEQTVDIESIVGIWHRRPQSPLPPTNIEEAFTSISQQESTAALQGLYQTLWDCRWVNPPHKEKLASHKIYQLNQAAYLGFSLPRTIITNNPQKALTFFNSCDKQMIYKPLSPLFAVGETDDDLYSIYTSLVTSESIEAHLDSIAISPCLFQELIPKQYELRVNVIGNYVWATAIYSQESGHTTIDYRHDAEGCRHEPVLIPQKLEEMCRQMNRALGLRMSNFDLILTPEGEYQFLEVNPNGQWAWVEDKVGFPLCTALVNELLGIDTLANHPYIKERSLHFEPNTTTYLS